jgi:hypothetical protein
MTKELTSLMMPFKFWQFISFLNIPILPPIIHKAIDKHNQLIKLLELW